MEKRKTPIIIISAITLLILAAVICICQIDMSRKIDSNITAVVTIENGQCEKKTYTIPFEIDKARKYEVNVKWWPESDPGFLTGCCLRDPAGKPLCGATGQKLDWNGKIIELEPGRYTMEFTILPSAAECDEFVRTNLPDAESYGNYFTDYRDGNWSLVYSLTVYRSTRSLFTAVIIILTVLGIALGLAIVISFSNKNTLKPEYDERQLIARYKSGTAGFITVTALLVIRTILALCNISIPAPESLIALFIILLGVTVMVIYGIANDGYYDLNSNIKKYTIFFFFLGTVMLILGIISGFRGALVENGRLSISALTPLIGIIDLAIGITTVIKERRSQEDEEE